jgi:hypothetical protein
MMNRLERNYFDWLVSHIEIGSTRTYLELFELMHDTDFIWIVPNDDNRLQDGLDLRREYLNSRARMSHKEAAHFEVELMDKGASVLEVLIGLSKRVAFTAGGTQEWWAWKLIENLRLNKCSDPLTQQNRKKIADILYGLIWRTYQRDGTGGFFPLVEAMEDQTKVEIWYQMNTYVNEIEEL